MPQPPEKLKGMLELFAGMQDRNERIQTLIDIADGFKEVSPSVASRPFPEERRVPHCESEAFVWSTPQPNGTLKYHFAVENPQGISAKATAVILDKVCSNAPPEQVTAVSPDFIYEIFGRELSMGKNMGLTAMVNMVKAEAIKQLASKAAEN